MGVTSNSTRAGVGWRMLAANSTSTEDELATTYATALRYVAERKKLGEFAKSTARVNWYTLATFSDSVGDLTVGRVQRKHIEKWLLARDVSPGTVRKELSVVRAFFKWCVEHDICRKDPTRGIKGPKQPRREPKGFANAEVGLALEHADNRMRVVVLLMCQEGLRRNAVITLTTDRVDLDQRMVLALEKGNKEIWKPLSDETAEAIKVYLDESPAGPGMPLIRSYQYPWKPIHPDHLSRLIGALLYECGLKRGPWDGKSGHTYRHTCASDMLDNGADIEDIRQMLGHEHLSSTEIYLRRQRAATRLRQAASGRTYGT